MRSRIPKILVTGAAGFMGSALVRLLLKRESFRRGPGKVPRRKSPLGYKVIVVDKLTYAADLARLKEVEGKYKFYRVDICDRDKIGRILEKERPDFIIHLAAETHVDRSIQDAAPFIRTNVLGTQVLLDLSRRQGIKKFIHISTDEVYGEIEKGSFTEESPLRPNSPYAASKAAADLLIKSYIRTYGFPAIIARPCNNYGPWQYPEKFIPLAILKILRNEKIPVYGKGRNVREWLFVEDCARGFLAILERGEIGQVYNLGSRQEKQNIEVANLILGAWGTRKNRIEFIKDRPGHDLRYSLDYNKASRQLGWQPRFNFKEGLAITLNWCLQHKKWLTGKWQDLAPFYK